MIESWRWYGPSDPVTLRDIRQAGAAGIVTALHEVKCGELWTRQAVAERAQMVEEAGMKWVVAESIAVHEDIKTHSGNWKHYLEVYKESLRNLAAGGVKVVCYNFMPVLDWTRSDLAFPLEDGSSVLKYDAVRVAAFDLFVLERAGAADDYAPETVARARELFQSMDGDARKALADSILLGLPGTVDDLTPEQFREMLKRYEGIDDAQLRRNLYDFLNEIMPVCEETGIRMAIHPDDPPRPIFGLPRIMSDEEDMRQLVREVPSMHSGFTLCTGSLGGLYSNAPHLLMEEFADRVYFAHFRNTVFDADHESFRESGSHLCGHTDMAYAMQCLLDEEARRKAAGWPDWRIPVRPDHGKLMDIDLEKHCYAGYSYGGRVIGLAELRGLAMGLQSFRPLAGKTAVVTGAAGVLCSVMARDLLKVGASVALLGRTRSKLEDLQRKLAEEGLGRTLVLAADVLDRAALEQACSRVKEEWGRLDILVNGAGGNDPRGTSPAEQCMPDTPAEQGFFGMDMEGFEYVNRLNMIGTILPSQVFGELLAASGGCIVNISSMAAFQPLTKVGAYGAAKAAVDNFTKWLATHLAPLGVRVNAIAPGFFITEQNRFLMMEKDGATPTPRGRKVLAKTPMHRFGEPEDLCGALRFLVSPSASFVTGVIIPVDGGFLAYSGV
ncbi:mannonate dehydratase [Akkermansia sp.]|uniref:mannonate dehydratase n=1 Tax=Akkermansia sp. TaxID=1872421 RepID=UPI003A91D520